MLGLQTKNIVMQSIKNSGQPLLCQLLSYIPKHLLQQAIETHQSDRYYKTMTTYRQLVFMFYGVISRINSLNSLCKSLLFLKNKLTYLGIRQLPAVSTLSDANKKRDSAVFGTLYFLLLNHYKKYLSHSYHCLPINGEVDPEKVRLFASTTLQLFLEVFTGAGPSALNGKRKGGLKVHALLPLDRYVPELVWMSPASYHDNHFLGQLTVIPGYTYVFDKGYHNYSIFREWTQQGVFYATRLKKNAQYRELSRIHSCLHEFMGGGVICDQTISLHKGNQLDFMKARLITYKDPFSGKVLKFLTNQFQYQATTVVALFKNRWLMETFFKQLKQNFELTGFYSDSRQGIKTQVWIALIAQLIFTVIHKQIRECELFTTLVSMSAANLGSYQCLISTIKSKRLVSDQRNSNLVQLYLFDLNGRGLFEFSQNSP